MGAVDDVLQQRAVHGSWRESQAMALWTMLVSAVGASAGILALLVAWLLLPVFTKLWRLRAIPSPPTTHWLLGHPGVIENCEKAPWVVHAYAKQLGRIFRLRMAHLHIVIVTDAAEALRLTSRGEHYLDKAAEIYVNAFNVVHGDPNAYNIVSLPTNAEWRAIRKVTSPLFASQHVRSALPLMLDIADSITQQWEAAGSSKVWNLMDISRRITLDIIARWGYDTDFRAVDDLESPNPMATVTSDALHAVHTVLMDPTHKLRPWSKAVRTGLKHAAAYDNWAETFTQQLLERKDTLPKDCIGRVLLDLEDPSLGGKLDRKRLVSNVAMFFVAGYETTAASMTMTLMLLLRHPEWLRRVEAELDAAGLLKTPARRQPRALTLADVNELQILNAVIKESLRLLPPLALGPMRCTAVDTEICGYTVPAGCLVQFPHLPLENARSSYGEDAEEFKPDRWLAKGASRWDEDLPGGHEVEVHATSVASQPQSVATPAHTAVPGRPKEPFAFSTGPRDCIGQTLARMELQVFLATLLSRFRLHLAPSMGTPQQALDSLVFRITITSANGVWMTAEAR